MKSTTDISTVKALLEKFYQGSTTPEEEAALHSYFAGEAAPELAADAEVFAALSALSPDDVQVPDGLEEKLMAMTSPVSPGRKALPVKRWIFAAMGAAAVLLAAVLVLKGPSSPYPQPVPDLSTLAQAKTIIAEPMPCDSGITVLPSPITDKHVPSVKKSMPAAVDAPLVADNQDNSDNYREITDPLEAARIMEEISALLAQNLIKGSDAVATMDMAFDQSAAKYQSVIQKIQR